MSSPHSTAVIIITMFHWLMTEIIGCTVYFSIRFQMYYLFSILVLYITFIFIFWDKKTMSHIFKLKKFYCTVSCYIIINWYIILFYESHIIFIFFQQTHIIIKRLLVEEKINGSSIKKMSKENKNGLVNVYIKIE